MNREPAIATMKNLGLTDVNLQRTDGESGRENVWILSGTKA